MSWKADIPFFHGWVLPGEVISLDIFFQWGPPRLGCCCVLQHFCTPEALVARDVIADRFQEVSHLVPSACLNHELLRKATTSPHALGPLLHALAALRKEQHILFSSLPSLSIHCRSRTCQFSPVFLRVLFHQTQTWALEVKYIPTFELIITLESGNFPCFCGY